MSALFPATNINTLNTTATVHSELTYFNSHLLLQCQFTNSNSPMSISANGNKLRNDISVGIILPQSIFQCPTSAMLMVWFINSCPARRNTEDKGTGTSPGLRQGWRWGVALDPVPAHICGERPSHELPLPVKSADT